MLLEMEDGRFQHKEVSDFVLAPGCTLQSAKAIDVADKEGLHGIRMVLESCLGGSNGEF